MSARRPIGRRSRRAARAGHSDSAIICFSDLRQCAYFEISAKARLTVDVNNHPFGYRDLRTVDYTDSPIAA